MYKIKTKKTRAFVVAGDLQEAIQSWMECGDECADEITTIRRMNDDSAWLANGVE